MLLAAGGLYEGDADGEGMAAGEGRMVEIMRGALINLGSSAAGAMEELLLEV
jgi:hypothetical protein